MNKEAVTADEPCLYFCGNSLGMDDELKRISPLRKLIPQLTQFLPGLQPKGTRELVTEELDLWAKAYVEAKDMA